MAGEPTLEELAAWCDVTLPDAKREPLLTEVLAAVVAFVEDECDVDAGGWDSRQHTAGLMLGQRFYRRRATPEGVAGFGDLGVIRVLADDPDVDRLLSRSLKLSGFGIAGTLDP